MENKDVRKELNELSPLLSKLREQSGRNAGDSIPEDYFRSIREKIITESLSEEKDASLRDKAQRARQRTMPQWVFAAAASFTLVIAAWWSFNTGLDSSSGDMVLNDLSYEELATYVDENLESFDESDLYSLVQDSDLADLDLLDSNVDELEIGDLEEEILEEFNYDELL